MPGVCLGLGCFGKRSCLMVRGWLIGHRKFDEGTQIVTVLPNWVVGQQIDCSVWMLLKRVLCLGGKM